jgi:two-component system, chemotaxis family, response regulator Rcp1
MQRAEDGAIGSIEILLVEDNPADAYLVQEALRESPLALHLTVIENGEHALSCVQRNAPYADAGRPDLILLDLHLPEKNGHEVLRELKSDPTLCVIPVVMLTSSQAPEDMRQSYALRVNAYVVKPLELEPFLGVVKAVLDFWGTVVQLPSG